jgi:hypothetical protein
MGSSLAAVADELEAADDLADGEETKELGQNDTAGDELGCGDVADVVDDGLGGLEEAAGSDRVPNVQVEGLETGDGREGNLLSLEHELAELKAHLGVIDDKRRLT